MSTTTSPGAPRALGRDEPGAASGALRFGQWVDDGTSNAAGRWSVDWRLKRNCSLAPRQLFACYGALCLLSLVVAASCWWFGARAVLPFAGIELSAVGVALLVYARHANDNESIALREDRLTVEHASGSRLERMEFQAQWVRVEPEAGDGSLVELSGQGRRIVVGRYVRPELRRQLADELRMALRHAH